MLCLQNEAREEVEEASKELAAAQSSLRACDESSEEPNGRKRLQKQGSSTSEIAEHVLEPQAKLGRQHNSSMVISDDDNDDLAVKRK